jgi:putative transposase
MSYTTASHTVFHNRYHLVWITKYRYKVLTEAMRLRIRDLTRQICDQLGVKIISGVLSSNHIHMFVEIPPRRSVSEVMRRVKGCSSRKIQQEFPELKKRYWGKRFWARGYFCTTSGMITNETIMEYIQNHTPEPTDNRR